MRYSEYLSNKSIRGFENFADNKRSKATRESYKSELNQFVDFVHKDALACVPSDGANYSDYLFSRLKSEHNYQGDLAFETLSKKIKMLKSLYNHMMEYNPESLPSDFTNPFSSVFLEEPVYRYDETNTLSLDEINGFFDFVLGRQKGDYLLLQLVFFSLIKPSELLKLKREHLVMKDHVFYIWLHNVPGVHKSEEREIKLPEQLGLNLAMHLKSHGGEYWFYSKNNIPMKLRTMQHRIKLHSDAYNPSLKITAQALYHAGIFQARKNGMELEEISYQAGIRDMEALKRYQVDNIDVEGLVSTCDYIKIKVF